MAEKQCIWKFYKSDSQYETSCSYAFHFEGNECLSPREPEFKFCPYCGKLIKRVTP